MIWEANLMAEAKKDTDKLLARQYARLKKYAERLADENDEKKAAAGKAVLAANFEELANFKNWMDTANDLIFAIMDQHQRERNEAFAKGLKQGLKQQDNFGFNTVGDYRAYREALQENQRIIWADHH